MKITIITAVRNAAGTIRDAMESVRRQNSDVGRGDADGLSVEYIVVDGGSTDGTVDEIRRFDERRSASGERRPNFSFRWISEPDRGMYDGINKGIGMATGNLVGILNADDVLESDSVLARVAEAWKKESRKSGDGELDCVYGKVRFVSGQALRGAEDGRRSDPASRLERLRTAKTVRRCFARLWRPWMLQWGYMPPHPGLFIRRECFAKWGAYEPDRREYRIAADYELIIRFFRARAMRAKYLGFGTTIMRTGGVSTKDVEARKKLNEEIIKANRANGYFCCWPMLLPKYAIKIWEVILPRIGICG